MRLITVIVALSVSSPAIARDVIKMNQYNCTRVTGSSTGFTNQQAFESWFPKKVEILNSADNEITIYSWGIDESKSANEAKNGISNYRHKTHNLRVDFNKEFDRVNMYLSAQGFKLTTPIVYKCAKAKRKSIDLDKVRKDYRD